MRTRQRNNIQDALFETNPQKEMVELLQAKVEAWISADYPHASELSRTLLHHWFGGPHLMADGITFFQWHLHQRQAVETAIYLYEVEGLRRTEQYAAFAGMERAAQKAPWTKVGMQLATGSGKTKVMSLLMVWAHLHWQMGDHNDALGFGGTQLLLAPNLIVLERLLADFANGAIFQSDPLVPPQYRADFDLQVVTPDTIPAQWLPAQGYLVVTNIQKLYPEDAPFTPAPITTQPELEYEMLGSAATPTKINMGTPRLVDFVQSAKTPLLVYNDEAHHVHDEAVHYGRTSAVKAEDVKEGVAWNRVLTAIQKRHGLALQVDLSATLFEEETKQWFRHTVYDYPLQQAIRDRIVKQPFMGKLTIQYVGGGGPSIPMINMAAKNAFDKYTNLIQAGIAEWKKEQALLDQYGIQRKALLFIVCNDKTEAKEITVGLNEFEDKETGEQLFRDKVIEIHIGKKEAQDEKAWTKTRTEIQRVDSNDSPYTAVVSVMMLKEGWDVRNVKVIVPLRPCDSRQLTEQLLGRGLRRMFPPVWSPEGERRDQSEVERLYVIRHPSFERIIKNMADIIEEEDDAEGAGQTHNPSRILVRMVEPASERETRDVPLTSIVGAFETGPGWEEHINRGKMPPLEKRLAYEPILKAVEGIIKHEGATDAAPIKEDPLRYEVQTVGYARIDTVISNYAEHIRLELRMTGSDFAAIKGVVKRFLERCTFDLPGITLSLETAEDDEENRLIMIENIRREDVWSAVTRQVSKIIGEARAGKETPLVQIKPSSAKDLFEFETTPTPYFLKNPAKCVHTLCCFDSGDERKLAELLDEADDVAAWIWNDQTGVGYRVQYSYGGRMPFYYPDFLVRLTNGDLYIVESKGSKRVRDVAKKERAERYAELLRGATGQNWQYLFLHNDPSENRRDISWWKQQGRTLFSDMVNYTQNINPSGGLL